MIYFCSLLLFLCGLVNYAYYRDGLAPGVLQPVLWALLLAGASTVQETYFHLSQPTLFLCVMASLAFQCGCLLGSSITPRGVRYTNSVDRAATLRIRNALFLLVLVILPFYVRTAFHLASSGPVDDMAFNLRYSLSEEGGGYGVLAYGVTVSLVLVILESMFFETGRKWRLAAAIMLASIFCVLLTGRTYVLALLVCFLFPLIIMGRVRASSGILLLLVIFLPVYYLYAVTLGKDGGGGVGSMGEVFRLYLYGGLFAFDKLALNAAELAYGDNLFRAFFAVLNLIDPPATVIPVVDDYQFIPEPTNVYTVFSKAYRDFGTAGVVIYLFFIGAMHGFVFARARLGALYYQIILVFSYFALVMQFFQDQYLGLLSTWVQVVALTVLFAVFTRPSHHNRTRMAPAGPPARPPRWPSAQQGAQHEGNA
jgi:oligosaccharide repeat unit polymerase